MTKFVFCFPYRGAGGVPVLFTRIAERLTRGGQHEAFVVDYPDGAMAKAVAGSRILLIPYSEEMPASIPDDAIVIFQSLNPWAMYPALRISGTTRIFFWNCHPFNLVPVFPGLRGLMMSNSHLGRLVLATVLRRYRNIVVRLIDFLLARDALVFMDKSNAENTENYLGISLPRRDYLPVPAGDVRERITRSPRDWTTAGLRLAWIGRIADFKYPVLRKTLLLLDRLIPALGVPVRFAIVGAGTHLDDLRRDITSLRNIEVELVGELPVSDIVPFLTEHVDILFAMGISALEGARLGVPTVLLDVAYGAVPDGYIFSWLHDRSGFTLGDVLSPSLIRPGNDSLETLLRSSMADFDGVSHAAHTYYEAAHSPDSVTEEFLRLARLSHCFYRDFESAGFSARDPVYELFSRLRKRFIS
jgi:hypothetical protein